MYDFPFSKVSSNMESAECPISIYSHCREKLESVTVKVAGVCVPVIAVRSNLLKVIGRIFAVCRFTCNLDVRPIFKNLSAVHPTIPLNNGTEYERVSLLPVTLFPTDGSE